MNILLALFVSFMLITNAMLCLQSYNFKIGMLFNKGAFWIGVHYSPYNQRYCINFVPFVTLWISLPCGNVPARSKM